MTHINNVQHHAMYNVMFVLQTDVIASSGVTVTLHLAIHGQEIHGKILLLLFLGISQA